MKKKWLETGNKIAGNDAECIKMATNEFNIRDLILQMMRNFKKEARNNKI